MDGGPLLVNDFLAHSEKIYVGEGPESIEVLNGKMKDMKRIQLNCIEYLGMLYTGLKNGSIVEIDPFTKTVRIIYSSLSVDHHQLDCGTFCLY